MPPNYFNLLNPKRVGHPLHKSLWLVMERVIRFVFAMVVYPMVFTVWSMRYPLNLSRFSLIPTKTAYMWHRYVLHATPCVIRKFYPQSLSKEGYVFDGVPLSKYEGFNEYMVRKQASMVSADSNTNTSLGPEENGCNVKEIGSPIDVASKIKIEPESSKSGIKWPHSAVHSIKEKEMQSTLRAAIVQRQERKKKQIVVKIPNSYSKQQQIKVVLKKHKLKPQQLQPKHVRHSGSTTDPQYISKVKNEIRNVFHSVPEYDDGSLAPIILRLCWHCCATYDKNSRSGGSNGATMRFVPEITDEGNTGLDIARAALEPIKQKFPLISYSDLWTLAGVLALEDMCEPLRLSELRIKWKPGRVDCFDNNKVPPNGRLPFANKDANHVRATFDRMGFDTAETVALCGAHGIGRCHKRFSGWEGKWTQNPVLFSNEFFRVLINEEWHEGIVPETGKQQYYNADKLLMMLNTDLVLTRDPEFRYWVEKYAMDSLLFFHMFSIAFTKLLELGINRDPFTSGVIASSSIGEPEE